MTPCDYDTPRHRGTEKSFVTPNAGTMRIVRPERIISARLHGASIVRLTPKNK